MVNCDVMKILKRYCWFLPIFVVKPFDVSTDRFDQCISRIIAVAYVKNFSRCFYSRN